jgi:hypothetical protein
LIANVLLPRDVVEKAHIPDGLQGRTGQQPPQVVDEEHERPVIDDEMVEHEREHRAAPGHLHRGHAKERRLADRDRLARTPAPDLPHERRRSPRRHVAQVVPGDRGLDVAAVFLKRLAADLDDAQAQRVVALRQRLQRLPQVRDLGRHVKRDGFEHVVLGAGGEQPGEEPDPSLARAQRHARPARGPLHLARVPPARPLLEQLLDESALGIAQCHAGCRLVRHAVPPP